jgi:hypothetical protein
VFMRILFAGDHGLDLARLEMKIEEYPAPPKPSREYLLGMRAYERLRASVRPAL